MAKDTAKPPIADFFRRFLAVAGGYWASDEKWRARLLTGTLGVLTIGQVIVPILINLWSQRLFDALEQRSMDRFLTMIAVVGAIIAFNIANTMAHLRVKRRLQLGWRMWLTRRLLGDWLARGRQLQVNYLPGEHDNPDGRIAEDIRITTEAAIDLGLSLSYCVMLLISFTEILWILSGAPEATLLGFTFTVPGYLIYIAMLYAAAGTTIAMVVGRPLMRAANRRQRFEADFRFGLARVRENAEAIALLHGEHDERRRMLALTDGVVTGWGGQTRALSNMMIFSATYSVLSAAFPVLVAAPRYISGSITLGVLMQTAQAFQQTVAALSWPIDNLPRAAEWSASVERVLGLHDAMQRLIRESNGDENERIFVERLESGQTLSFRGLTVMDPTGNVIVQPFDADIQLGERVLIAGDPGATVRLFKAVARVWPWGRGRIVLPADQRVFFMPQRPYVPPGSLRSALAYPLDPETVNETVAREVLTQVGLAYLASRLDEDQNWEAELAAPEQQRLGFARLLIQRPSWIFIEDATDALDPLGEEDMLRLLDEEFPHATLLTIGNHASLAAHHRRRFDLERTNGSVRVIDTQYTLPVDVPCD
jgi:putative ATP-binding cassette transporter